jgi:hypothetical protein
MIYPPQPKTTIQIKDRIGENHMTSTGVNAGGRLEARKRPLEEQRPEAMRVSSEVAFGADGKRLQPSLHRDQG